MEHQDKLIDNTTVVVVTFAVVGLIVASVTFGFLNSQAQGQFHGYQVGGAAAGFAVTFILLTSFYLQVRKAKQEPEKLRERIEELQQKLLRGTPHPAGFVVEIAEQQKIVLARPETWERRGGVIFDFELAETRKPNDLYPARFTCSYVPIRKEYKTKGRDHFYNTFVTNIKQGELNYNSVTEYFSLGGEPNSIKSVKVIACQYMRIERHQNAYGGKERLEALKIRQEDFLKANASAPSPRLKEPASECDDSRTIQDVPGDGQSGGKPKVDFAVITHMFVACYQEDLGNIFFFEFIDDEDDFIESSENFNKVLESTRFLFSYAGVS